MEMLRWGALVLACCSTTLACYSPRIEGCNILCDENSLCPDGLACNGGFCRAEDNDTCGSPPIVTAGAQHACSINGSGQLSCWGSNERGQITGAPGDPVTTPLVIAGDGRWVAVDGGREHTCAIALTSGGRRAFCWGDNQFGQSGAAPSSSPVTTTEILLDDPIEISAGGRHSCVRTGDGRLHCWGSNSDGQLGSGDNPDVFADARVVSGGATDWVHVTTGDFATCGTHADGRAQCWGSNSEGQLGDTTGINSFVPVDVKGALFDPERPVKAITLGTENACMVHDDGGPVLRCWGTNGFRQAGRDQNESPIFDATDPIAGFGSNPVWVDVRANNQFACALDVNKQIYCWGRGDARLGDNCNNCRATPGPDDTKPLRTRDNEPLPPAIAFDVGDGFGCAVFGGDRVSCWGSNSHGQLKNKELTTVSSALEIPGQTSGDIWSVVRLGHFFGCAIKEVNPPKEVWCWGENDFGQVNPGGAAIEPVLVMHAVPLDPIDVALGDNHACALMIDLDENQATCWGSNLANELGDPTAVGSIANPVLPPGFEWVQIAAGHDATCVVSTNSTVACWGSASWLNAPTPTIQGFLFGLGNLRIGPDGGCGEVIATPNTFECWGSNADGLRGDNSGNPTPDPLTRTLVASGGPITDVSESIGRHRCAVAVSTEGDCWGRNDVHQVSDADNPSFEVPQKLDFVVKAPALSTDRMITTGGAFTCAIDEMLTVACWGDNSFNQCTAGGANNGGMPTPIDAGTSNFTTLSSGVATTCAIESGSRRLYCWGDASRGQTGTGVFDPDFVLD